MVTRVLRNIGFNDLGKKNPLSFAILQLQVHFPIYMAGLDKIPLGQPKNALRMQVKMSSTWIMNSGKKVKKRT